MTKKIVRSKSGSRKQKREWRVTPIIREIVASAGSQLALSKVLTPAVSRPLLVALCQAQLGGTPNSMGRLSQVCSEELADKLLKAYLEDVLEEVVANAGSRSTSGRAPKNSSVKQKVVLIGTSEKKIIESYFSDKAVPEHWMSAMLAMAERCSSEPAFRAMVEKLEITNDLLPAYLTHGLVKTKR